MAKRLNHPDRARCKKLSSLGKADLGSLGNTLAGKQIRVEVEI
jgi:hypothetical protein